MLTSCVQTRKVTAIKTTVGLNTHTHTHTNATFTLAPASIKMAALGGRVNGIICHANQGREHACPLDLMSLLADMTAANSLVSPPCGAMPTS